MEKEERVESKEKVFLGSLGILYRAKEGVIEFLVVENAKTGNISFVAGAKENFDSSEIDAMNRELEEELGLQIGSVRFQPTEVRHEFIFGPQKKDRAGHPGSYQVFLADVTDIGDSILHTKELRGVKWLRKDEVLNSLSFADLKEVFLKATEGLS